MARPNLKQTFEEAKEPSEIADAFHRFLSQYHPLDAHNADILQKRIDQLPDIKRKERLTKLKHFLSIYHVGDMKGKPSRHWNAQINVLTQLTNDFIATKGMKPESLPQLLEYMVDIIGDDLRLHFNSRAKHNELSYDAVYSQVSKKFDSKGRKVPDEAKAIHDFTYGNRESLKEWWKNFESRDWNVLLEKINYYSERHQFNAVSDILEMSAEFAQFIPPKNIIRLGEKPRINPAEIKYAEELNWQSDLLYGITRIFSDEKISHKFNPETYKKIRNFLAFEYDNLRELNRAAALMSMVFPEYNDFTKYILKNARYNENSRTLDLTKLIDTANFEFQDNDYKAWGELLLDQGPSRFFYLKTAHLLDEIPRNEKNKILISRLDRQLYDKIADLVGFCSNYDCSRYSELKIVSDVLSIQKFKEECRADTENMPDRVSTIPEVILEGERFGKPGYTFRRLSYNDDRFFVVGRFTKSCEYIDGEWGATVREGYKNRASTYYCLFNANDKIIAHSWAYVHPSWEHVVLDGFEADQNEENVSKVILEKIVDEINLDKARKAGIAEEKLLEYIKTKPYFVVGSSAQHLNLEQIKTIRRGEELQDHVKVINQDDLVDFKRMFEQARIPLFHANPSQNDSEELKAATQPLKPKDP